MTPFDKFLEFLSNTWRVDMMLLGKGSVLLFLLLYFMFSLMVLKQTKIMCQTVTGVLEKELILAAKILVGIAIVAFILGVVIL